MFPLRIIPLSALFSTSKTNLRERCRQALGLRLLFCCMHQSFFLLPQSTCPLSTPRDPRLWVSSSLCQFLKEDDSQSYASCEEAEDRKALLLFCSGRVSVECFVKTHRWCLQFHAARDGEEISTLRYAVSVVPSACSFGMPIGMFLGYVYLSSSLVL